MIVGGVVSWMVTVKLQTLVLPLWSVAMQTTVFVPSANNEPEGGRQTTVGFVSQVSVAEVM
jgi:hypothetical protein